MVAAAVGAGAEEAIGTRAPADRRARQETSCSRARRPPTRTRRTTAACEKQTSSSPPVTPRTSGFRCRAATAALYGVLSVYGRRRACGVRRRSQALAALAANAAAALTNAELYQRVAVEREQSVAILANIADGIVAVDRDGHVVLWNSAAEEITGVPTSEAVGRTPAQVLQRELESETGGTTGSSRSSGERTTCGCRFPRR